MTNSMPHAIMTGNPWDVLYVCVGGSIGATLSMVSYRRYIKRVAGHVSAPANIEAR